VRQEVVQVIAISYSQKAGSRDRLWGM